MSKLKIRSIRQAEKETASLLKKIQAAGISSASCEAYGADIGVQVWPPFPDHDSGHDLVAVLVQNCWEITLTDSSLPHTDGDNTLIVEAATTADAVAFILDWSQRGGHW
jgi:hypothetical protein